MNSKEENRKLGKSSDAKKTLRTNAENKLKSSSFKVHSEHLNPNEIKNLIHDFQIHQIELEMQNNELRLSQEALEISRADFVDLYDFAPIGYVTVSGTGLINNANLTAATMLGLSRKFLIGQYLTKFILPEDQDVYYSHKKNLFNSGEAQTCELRMQCSGTASFWARLEATLRSEGGNDPPSCRIIISDISALKHTLEKQEKLKSQLFQAQKAETIGRLAGGIAHDFNNMLEVILGYAELAMLSAPPESTLEQALSEIRKAALLSADLTKQLLTFARKQIIHPAVLDLNLVVNPILKMLKRLVGEDIEILWQPGEGLGAVEIDKFQIEQILTNIIVNARDAIQKSGSIAIKTYSVEFQSENSTPLPDMTPEKYIVLSVTDNGIGMTQESLAKLFEPYYTTKPLGKGTGLGMAMVYGIVKQNRGFISVRSKRSSGTVVDIYFPCSTKEAVQIQNSPLPEKPAVATGKTILLVEDNESILEATIAMLDYLGYISIPTTSPLKALELAEKNGKRIDLLLTDVLMPQMNGLELALKLRIKSPELKILFISGYNADIINQNEILEKNSAYLQKPFLLKDLSSKLQELLG